jgi:cysteine-rich repeat protein
MQLLGLVFGAFAWIEACSLDAGGLGGDGAAASTSTEDGAGSASGGIEAGRCGDGKIDPGEECDDTNTGIGDGCSALCKIEKLDACPGLNFNLSPSGRTIHGHLTGLQDDVHPSCGPQLAPDVIYSFTPTVTGTVSVTLRGAGTFARSLSLRSACPDNGALGELACHESPNGDVLPLLAWVSQGVTYYVIVDGDPDDFTLDFTLSKCGNGIQEGLEECDDQSCPSCVSCTGAGEFWDAAHTRCYRFFNENRSWSDARESCVEWGGDLVGLSTTTEFDDVVTHPLGPAELQPLWTGGYALSIQCAYIWSDGEAWRQDNWGLAQPDNLTPPESCVSLSRQLTGQYKMLDELCTALHPYLCERIPANSCSGQCAGKCEMGEFVDPLTHHCYRVVTERTASDFAVANQSCVNDGSYLAVISSQAENALVQSHLTSDAWIGGRFSSVFQWQWLDGEPFCFDAWRTGEPSPGEDCIEMQRADGQWNNAPCTVKRAFVCERDP